MGKEHKPWQWALSIGGIMGTLLVYGVLQVPLCLFFLFFFFAFCHVISYERLVLGLRYGSRGFRNVFVLLYN